MRQGADPDILVDLTTARNTFEAQVIAHALEAQGIPARAFDLAGTILQWDVAVSQPIRVVVRRRDLESARSILRGIRSDSVDLDWSEVETGDQTPVTPQEQLAREARFRRPDPAQVWSRGRRAGWIAVVLFALALLLYGLWLYR